MMPNIMDLLLGGIPREVRDLGEGAIAHHLVDGSREEILETYDRARAAGASEHDAALAGCRRMITHKL